VIGRSGDRVNREQQREYQEIGGNETIGRSGDRANKGQSASNLSPVAPIPRLLPTRPRLLLYADLPLIEVYVHPISRSPDTL
jgi:hypothetical protein